MFDIKKLVDEIGIWQRKTYPGTIPEDTLNKLSEEVGELCQARQKRKMD